MYYVVKLRALHLPVKIAKITCQPFDAQASPFDDDEIKFISEWLERNTEHRKTWPISTLFTLLEKIMEDGKVDQSERLQLMSLFSRLAIFSDNE